MIWYKDNIITELRLMILIIMENKVKIL